MGWQQEYQKKLVSFDEAASVIKSGDRITMAAGPSAPFDLANAISARYKELHDVSITSGIIMYPFDFLKAEYKGHILCRSIFVGPVERYVMQLGNIEVIPHQFSSVEYLLTEYIKPNVWIVEVSEPDDRGYMSYGPIGNFVGDSTRKIASTTIVQVNKRTPYINGLLGHVHVSEVDYICEKDHELPQIPYIEIEDVHKKIASYIVDMIPDGATIQLGLGTIANAVGYLLDSKKNLGIHTEMVTNSMMDLVKKGVINCSKKTFRPGKITCCFGIGSTELYDFMDHNIMIENMPITMVNDIRIIAQNDNFVSVNNALMVDLTGQVCSETIGFSTISSTGGQLDFVRGARLAKNGKSFIALQSTENTKNGIISKICTSIPPGTAVTTPRTDVHYIATEYGVADLYCKSIPDRVNSLIKISHPDFRDQLRDEAKKAGLIS